MSSMSVGRKAGILVAVVFLLGGGLGAMLGFMLAHRVTYSPPGQVSDDARRAQKVQRLTQELNLTPEQQKQLDVIFANVQAQYKAIHESTDPQINEARQKGREQIRAILTAEQKPKFEEFLRRLDEEKKRHAQK
jgi:Spy/CpxP family protein refolding chaperone